MTMHHFRYIHSARIPFGLWLGAALALMASVVSLTSSADAQVLPRDPGCGALAASCPAGVKSSSCVALRQRCHNGAEGTKARGASGGTSVGMSQLDHPTDMPHCAEGQELMMVPTCKCASALETGAPPGDPETCATCNNDGVRLECQNVH
jgi:hypothetical protein